MNDDLETHISDDQLLADLRQGARSGLTSSPKWLSPMWFYDARGSELFEQITVLPEYYPTRTERALIEEHALDIAIATKVEILVELGSGSSDKTRLLLDAGLRGGVLRQYVPQDVSVSALRGAIDQLNIEFPELKVHGIVSDFTDTLDNLPRGGQRSIAFLGGTLGNFIPSERAVFLTKVAGSLDAGEFLLLGVGLIIDPAILVPAYDDAAGVTAAFNMNVLHVLNNRLGADFAVDQFEHHAVWDAQNEWIEMRLRARSAQTVHIANIDLDITLAAGEEIRTEISAKFRQDGISAELAGAGFEVSEFWTDPEQRFALILARRN